MNDHIKQLVAQYSRDVLIVGILSIAVCVFAKGCMNYVVSEHKLSIEEKKVEIQKIEANKPYWLKKRVIK